MMQSSTAKMCLGLLATAAALQAPTHSAVRRVVAQKAPVDVLAPTSSTALCAGGDDNYKAPKIEFDPDAEGAHAASPSTDRFPSTLRVRMTAGEPDVVRSTRFSESSLTFLTLSC